jgi:HSP20 family protein
MLDLTPFGRSFRGLDSFREIDDFEKRFFGKPLPTFRTDIRETEEAYVLEAELPGFTKDEIRATVRNELLTVIAEHSSLSEESEEKDGYIRRERMRGTFSRSFDISGVRVEEITATFENGILTVILPKADPKRDTQRELEIH